MVENTSSGRFALPNEKPPIDAYYQSTTSNKV